MTVDGGLRFAVTYSVLGSKNIDFADELATLHRAYRYSEDEGDLAVIAFYEVGDDGFVELDVSALDAEAEARHKREMAEYRERNRRKPYRVYLYGPDRSCTGHNDHDTYAAAVLWCVQHLPPAIGYSITDKGTRPFDVEPTHNSPQLTNSGDS